MVGEALGIGGAGVAGGLLLGLGVGQMLGAVFVDIASFDAWVFAMPAVGLLLACVVAAWAPARRASRLDPSQVLRAE